MTGYGSQGDGVKDTVFTTNNMLKYNSSLTTLLQDKGFTNNFRGTSAAAPVGRRACILQANPYLNWREVQHILVITSNKIGYDPARDHRLQEYQTNDARLKVSNSLGHGIVDCGKAVTEALRWKNEYITRGDEELSYEFTLLDESINSDWKDIPIYTSSLNVVQTLIQSYIDPTSGGI